MSKGNLKPPRSTEKHVHGGRAACLKEKDASFQNSPLCWCLACVRNAQFVKKIKHRNGLCKPTECEFCNLRTIKTLQASTHAAEPVCCNTSQSSRLRALTQEIVTSGVICEEMIAICFSLGSCLSVLSAQNSTLRRKEGEESLIFLWTCRCIVGSLCSPLLHSHLMNAERNKSAN